MDSIAVGLSIFSTIVALISVYLSQFKKGKVVVPPLRAYRIVPLNFNVEGESYRSFRVYLMLTFLNTGAKHRALADFRIRVRVKQAGEDLFLDWENESPSLFAEYQNTTFASQPTLGPYDSTSRIYTFCSRFDVPSGKLVAKIEEVEKEEDKQYVATLELRKSENQWVPLRQFMLKHDGRIRVEDHFDHINSVGS